MTTQSFPRTARAHARRLLWLTIWLLCGLLVLSSEPSLFRRLVKRPSPATKPSAALDMAVPRPSRRLPTWTPSLIIVADAAPAEAAHASSESKTSLDDEKKTTATPSPLSSAETHSDRASSSSSAIAGDPSYDAYHDLTPGNSHFDYGNEDEDDGVGEDDAQAEAEEAAETSRGDSDSPSIGVGGASADHGRRHGPAYEKAMRALRFYRHHLSPETRLLRKGDLSTQTAASGDDVDDIDDEEEGSSSTTSASSTHDEDADAETDFREDGRAPTMDSASRTRPAKKSGLDAETTTAASRRRDTSGEARRDHRGRARETDGEAEPRRFAAFHRDLNSPAPETSDRPLGMKLDPQSGFHNLMSLVHDNDIRSHTIDDNGELDDDALLPPAEEEQRHPTLREFILELSVQEARHELNLPFSSESPFTALRRTPSPSTEPKRHAWEQTRTPRDDSRDHHDGVEPPPQSPLNHDIPNIFRASNFTFDDFEWIHCLPLLPIYPIRHALTHLHHTADRDSALTLFYAPHFFPDADYGDWLRLFTYLAVTLNLNGVSTQSNMYKLGVAYAVMESTVHDAQEPALDPDQLKDHPVAPQCALLHNRTLAIEAGIPLLSPEERDVMRRVASRVGVIDGFYPSWQRMAHHYWTTVIPAAECLMKTTYHYDLACIRARILSNLEEDTTMDDAADGGETADEATLAARRARRAQQRNYVNELLRHASKRGGGSNDDDNADHDASSSATTDRGHTHHRGRASRTAARDTSRNTSNTSPSCPSSSSTTARQSPSRQSKDTTSATRTDGTRSWWRRALAQLVPSSSSSSSSAQEETDEATAQQKARWQSEEAIHQRWQKREGHYRDYWRRVRHEASHEEPLNLAIPLAEPEGQVDASASYPASDVTMDRVTTTDTTAAATRTTADNGRTESVTDSAGTRNAHANGSHTNNDDEQSTSVRGETTDGSAQIRHLNGEVGIFVSVPAQEHFEVPDEEAVGDECEVMDELFVFGLRRQFDSLSEHGETSPPPTATTTTTPPTASERQSGDSRAPLRGDGGASRPPAPAAFPHFVSLREQRAAQLQEDAQSRTTTTTTRPPPSTPVTESQLEDLFDGLMSTAVPSIDSDKRGSGDSHPVNAAAMLETVRDRDARLRQEWLRQNPPLSARTFAYAAAAAAEKERDEAAARILHDSPSVDIDRDEEEADMHTHGETRHRVNQRANEEIVARATEARERLRRVLRDSSQWTQRQWRLEASILVHVIAVEGASFLFPSLFFPWQFDPQVLCSNATWSFQEIMVMCNGASDMLSLYRLYVSRHGPANSTEPITVPVSELQDYVEEYVTNLVVNFIFRHHLHCHAAGLSLSRCYRNTIVDPVSALEVLHKSLYTLRSVQSQLVRKIFALAQIFKYSLVPSSADAMADSDKVGYSSEWLYAAHHSSEDERRTTARLRTGMPKDVRQSTQPPPVSLSSAPVHALRDITHGRLVRQPQPREGRPPFGQVPLEDLMIEFDTQTTIPQGQTFLPLVPHNEAYYYKQQMRAYLGGDVSKDTDAGVDVAGMAPPLLPPDTAAEDTTQVPKEAAEEDHLTAPQFNEIVDSDVSESDVEDQRTGPINNTNNNNNNDEPPQWGILPRDTIRRSSADEDDDNDEDESGPPMDMTKRYPLQRPDKTTPTVSSSEKPVDSASQTTTHAEELHSIYGIGMPHTPTPLTSQEVHALLRGGTTASFATVLRGRAPVLFSPYLQGSRPFWLPQTVVEASIKLRNHIRAGTPHDFPSAESVRGWDTVRHSVPALPPFLRLFLLEARRLEAEKPGAREEREAMYHSEMVRWVQARLRHRQRQHCADDLFAPTQDDEKDDKETSDGPLRTWQTTSANNNSDTADGTTTWHSANALISPFSFCQVSDTSNGALLSCVPSNFSHSQMDALAYRLDQPYTVSSLTGRLPSLVQLQYFFEFDRFFLMDPARYVESSPLFLSGFLRTPVDVGQNGLMTPLAQLDRALAQETAALLKAELTHVLAVARTRHGPHASTGTGAAQSITEVTRLLSALDLVRISRDGQKGLDGLGFTAHAHDEGDEEEEEEPDVVSCTELSMTWQRQLLQAWTALAYAPRHHSHFLGLLHDPLLVSYTDQGRESRAVVRQRARRQARRERAARLANGTATAEDQEAFGPWSPPWLTEEENAALIVYLYFNGTAERAFRLHPTNERRCRIHARLQLATRLQRESRMITLDATKRDHNDHVTSRFVEEIWRAMRLRRDLYQNIIRQS